MIVGTKGVRLSPAAVARWGAGHHKGLPHLRASLIAPRQRGHHPGAKFIICNAKIIIFNVKFIIFNANQGIMWQKLEGWGEFVYPLKTSNRTTVGTQYKCQLFL